MVVASNLKFHDPAYAMRHHKSVSLPYGFLSESKGKQPFSPLIGKGGRSLQYSSHLTKVERAVKDQNSPNGDESFSDVGSDEGSHQQLFQSTLLHSQVVSPVKSNQRILVQSSSLQSVLKSPSSARRND